MRKSGLAALLLCLCASVAQATTTTETIVFFRHGEKPSGGYGQLTCQGFNRAINLYDALIPRYGKPAYLFAPSPTPKIADSAGSYYYVRPLATIEPMAVRLGLPVNAHYGYADVTSLTNALTSSSYSNSKVFVAWEHASLVKAVQMILNKYDAGVTAPAWTYGDYDSLYVVKLVNVNGSVTATFRKDFEGLNNQSTSCPR